MEKLRYLKKHSFRPLRRIMNKSLLIYTIIFLLVLFFKSHVSTASEYASEIFSKIRTENLDISESLGSYSKGCLAGAKYLPSNQSYYDALKPSRNRYWGHPNLINFIEEISQKIYSQYGNGILIGDMAMPRGGPMPFGHKSHQNGLDVDIFYQRKPDYQMQRFDLETYQPKSILTENQEEIQNDLWSNYHHELLEIISKNKMVTRIFVNPVIKKKLCIQAIEKNDTDWLKKIRPWGGHYKHFHVRLECPQESGSCIGQTPVRDFHGCNEELDNWLKKDKIFESNSNKIKKWILLSDLPKSCKKVIQ